MDNLSPERRSANMRAVRNRNTRPEIVVRRVSHALGYRFRVHVSKLPGKPDLVFASRYKVIFVHGCFWHRHGCKHGLQVPKTNTEFWEKKIKRNMQRDRVDVQRLRKIGWRSLIIWECQTKNLEKLEGKLRRFLI